MDLILTHTPVATLVVDSTLRISQASLSCLRLLRLAEEDCIGVLLHQVVGGKLSPDALRSFQNEVDEAMRSKEIRVLEYLPSTADESWKGRIVPIFADDEFKYIVLELENVPKKEPKTEAVKKQEENNQILPVLVNSVNDYAIFMLDSKGYIQTWNAGAALLKGYTAEEIIGKHFSVFYGEEDLLTDKPGRELEICLQKGKVEDEGWRYRKDGSRFWANVTITAVYQSNKLVGFGKVTRDLTERKMAEERLVSAYKETDKLKSAFLANMSHEIRTPMHGMLCAIGLLSHTNLNDEQKELSGIIEESGSVLLQVINDVLDYSKLASGLHSLSTDTFNISDVLAAISRSIQTTLPPSVRIETSSAPDLPHLVSGDKLRYRQIVQNFGSNAAKFTENGLISIHASVIESGLDTYTILTEVKDTGIGVPETEVNSLFKPFTQFDNSATKRYKGTGLGLSICKTLTEMMGGTIGYRANPGQPGSVFWFTIKVRRPVKLAERPLKKVESAEARPPIEEVVYGKHLLLAEDNIINQKVMIKMLRSMGFGNVDIASDGRRAADMVHQHPSQYDLILMDINMPVLDGLSASEEIRASGLSMPIIAMTANALKGDSDTYLARGMTDYVPKPVNRALLLDILVKWLK